MRPANCYPWESPYNRSSPVKRSIVSCKMVQEDTVWVSPEGVTRGVLCGAGSPQVAAGPGRRRPAAALVGGAREGSSPLNVCTRERIVPTARLGVVRISGEDLSRHIIYIYIYIYIREDLSRHDGWCPPLSNTRLIHPHKGDRDLLPTSSGRWCFGQARPACHSAPLSARTVVTSQAPPA
jgi:hypothetical protein